MIPIPEPATTAEGALACLAGALKIAVELMLEEQGDQATIWGKILIIALAQWEKSGFAQIEAQTVAEDIARWYILTFEKKK